MELFILLKRESPQVHLSLLSPQSHWSAKSLLLECKRFLLHQLQKLMTKSHPGLLLLSRKNAKSLLQSKPPSPPLLKRRQRCHLRPRLPQLPPSQLPPSQLRHPAAQTIQKLLPVASPQSLAGCSTVGFNLFSFKILTTCFNDFNLLSFTL